MEKEYTITGSKNVRTKTYHDSLNIDIKATGRKDTMQVSDGYHTMDELYDHRIQLFISLCKNISDIKYFPWRSKFHSDASVMDGWFILGIGKKEGEQITYHIPIERWDDTYFAETLEYAPIFDGHTSADVLERLKNL